MEKPIDINILDHVQIATPCTASWEEMKGNDTTRHCSHCSLNVYNISAMTSDEADALIANAEGRLCIRFYRRADGTVLTQDCPVGLRAVRQRVLRSVRNVAVTTVALLGGMLGFGFKRAGAQPSMMMGRMVMPERARTDTTVKHDTIARKPHVVKPHVVKPHAVKTDTVTPKPRAIMGEMMEVPKPTRPTPPVAVSDTATPPPDNVPQTTDCIKGTIDAAHQTDEPPVSRPVNITPDHSTEPARIN
ncbi:MAG: hypothetical protein JWQ98_1748 [Chlorobi bacterium]|nr:hypothetical protein [Chlorobiota bacterium]